MTLLIDTGSYAWRASYTTVFTWDRTDKLVNKGAIFCMDSPISIRQEKISWYKDQRPGKDIKYPEQGKHREMVRKFIAAFKRRYTIDTWAEVEGAEADDVIGLLVKPGDTVMSLDKDMLTIPIDFDLIDTSNKQWSIERYWNKVKVPIHRGRSFLAYQLMTGDTADNIPRLVHTKDRKTMPWVMEQENPLYWAIKLLPEDRVRESLNALMLPTPLLFDLDSISEAMKW